MLFFKNYIIMKAIRFLKLICLLAAAVIVKSQSRVDSVQFFLDEQPLTVTLSTDLGNLLSGKIKDEYQEATFTCKLPDSSEVSEKIRLNTRGHSRKQICYFPPVRLLFKNPSSPRLSSLKTLKLVNVCRSASGDKQLLLKEYLIYKIYNLLTDKSFRVRLLNITFEDSKGKKKSFTQYGFLVENVDAVAKRNKCKEMDNVKMEQETSDRQNMTQVALFEYMIGNTDWSVWNNHNIKLLYAKKDSTAQPFALPYDFDNSGFVNADYAVPDPIMRIESVTERVYRGFARSQEELDAAIQVFNSKKDKIYGLISNFEPLAGNVKKMSLSYLDDFYKTINDPKDVKYVFMTNARKE
jgi:hypothetical protein